jgi:hypothetical protein
MGIEGEGRLGRDCMGREWPRSHQSPGDKVAQRVSLRALEEETATIDWKTPREQAI